MNITFYLIVKGTYSAIYMSVRMPDSPRLQVKVPFINAEKKDWSQGRFQIAKGKAANQQKQLQLDKCRENTMKYIDDFYRKNQSYPSKQDFERFLLHGNHKKVTTPVKTIQKSKKSRSILPEILKLINEFEHGQALSNSRRMSSATIDGYKQIYSVLAHYQSEKNRVLTAKSITEESTIRSIEEYLTIDRNMKLNTVGKRLRNLKSILSKLSRKEIILKNPFHTYGIKTPKEDADNIAITIDELNALESIDLSGTKTLEHVRDHFICMCFTGLRVSDYREFVSLGFYQSVVDVHTVKTNMICSIPILPATQRVIDKYGGKLPPLISSQKMAKSIKKICSMISSLNELAIKSYTRGGRTVVERIPRYQMVSNHTARRTFITMMRRQDIPEETIMSITGHRDTRSLRSYNKMRKSEAAQKLLSYYKEKRDQ